MTQASHNWRSIGLFIGIVVLFVWIMALLFLRVLTPSQLFPATKCFGIATFAGVLAAIALNNYLWRLPFFRHVLGIPDLSGRWEGWRFCTLKQDWSPTAHEISQRALDIAAEGWGMKNWVRGTCASIITDRHGGAIEIVWSYQAGIISDPCPVGGYHAGTHYLRLSERDGHRYLEGRYINDRLRDDGTMGSVGFIRLIRAGATLKGALAFTDEAAWAMSKPQGEPRAGQNCRTSGSSQ